MQYLDFNFLTLATPHDHLYGESELLLTGLSLHKPPAPISLLSLKWCKKSRPHMTDLCILLHYSASEKGEE